MKPVPSRFLSMALLAAALASSAAARDFRLTVAPADVDRAVQVVSFPLPPDTAKPAALRDATGATVPLQVDADGTARFVIVTQKAGESLTFTLTSTLTPGETGVTVTPDHGDLHISIGGRPALFYRMDAAALPRADIDPKFKRAGYLHPVFGPAGRVVTGDFPSNHVHHHAIWTAWPKTRFQGRTPNSWEMGEQTGTVEFTALDRTWSGPVHGGFTARQRMLDLSAASPTAVLDETWELTAYQVPGTRVPVQVFDLTVTQACATNDTLVLPKYHYGGLGYRGPDHWDGKPNLRVLTSNGETDREKANLSRVNWCHVGGADAGTTVLGHPDNFRSPQPIRVHPDMPFLCFAPSQLGDWSIEPGRPYVARYRFVVTDGPPDPAFLEACWSGYAQTAGVKIEPL